VVNYTRISTRRNGVLGRGYVAEYSRKKAQLYKDA
jgi:hypothetical protein